MNERDEQRPDALDQATSRRLERLRALPVDTTGLDRRIGALIPKTEQAMPARLWLRTSMRIAAVLALATGIATGVILLNRDTPAIASPVELVRLHDDAIAGRGHVVQVQSLDEAQRVLAQQWSARPDLPQVPGVEVMACCLHEMGKARMAVVTINADGVPVTLAVADAGDLRSPRTGQTQRRNGIEWHVQSAGDVNMVSTRRDDRWICLMGRAPTEKLMELAQSVKF